MSASASSFAKKNESSLVGQWEELPWVNRGWRVVNTKQAAIPVTATPVMAFRKGMVSLGPNVWSSRPWQRNQGNAFIISGKKALQEIEELETQLLGRVQNTDTNIQEFIFHTHACQSASRNLAETELKLIHLIQLEAVNINRIGLNMVMQVHAKLSG